MRRRTAGVGALGWLVATVGCGSTPYDPAWDVWRATGVVGCADEVPSPPESCGGGGDGSTFAGVCAVDCFDRIYLPRWEGGRPDTLPGGRRYGVLFEQRRDGPPLHRLAVVGYLASASAHAGPLEAFLAIDAAVETEHTPSGDLFVRFPDIVVGPVQLVVFLWFDDQTGFVYRTNVGGLP